MLAHAATLALILPRMLFERFLPAPTSTRHERSSHRSTIQEWPRTQMYPVLRRGGQLALEPVG
jgi:hypothetical protein